MAMPNTTFAHNPFVDVLSSNRTLLADGAMGTALFERGLLSGESPEKWNLDYPERVLDVHRCYVSAGSDILLTNSFGGNRFRLKLHGLEDRVAVINSAAASIARSAAAGAGRPVVIAGSMGPTGELLEPMGTLTASGCAAAYAEQAQGLEEGGVDVLWLETLSDLGEVRAAIDGIRSVSELPIAVTMSFDTNGRTMMGITPAGFGELAATLPNQPAAIGANCGTGAAELVATVMGISEARPDAIVVAKGNCGIPEYVDGHIHYSGTPELMADYARLALDAGARIIGGCCGTTNEHLKAMRESLEGYGGGPRPEIAEVEARLGAVSALAHGHDAVAEAAASGGRRGRRRRG